MHAAQGLTYLGSNWRLRRAVHKLLSEPAPELWIGVIGGSITQGHTVQHDEIWFTILQDWLVSRQARVASSVSLPACHRLKKLL